MSACPLCSEAPAGCTCYGWCHHCETFQLREDAPVLRSVCRVVEPCCVVCRESEPWGFGVWNAGQFTVDGGQRALNLSWDQLAWLCERRVSTYPGDFDGLDGFPR